jgi:hypothetical protein
MKNLFLIILAVFMFSGCNIENHPDSDQIQKEQQERILQQGTSSVGMPSIKNFREKRILKDILELRDQDGLVTYTYIVANQTGKLIFLGQTIGYGIPAATQFTNPQKEVYEGGYERGFGSLPQADPNGLFSPSSAEGTWVLMKDPNGSKTLPVYIEERIIVSPFKLN